MALLPITVASWDYDRVRALIDGRVRAEGCEINYLALAPEECFHRAHFFREFDVSEIGISHYLADLSRGEAGYIAIPVFLSRMFRHSAIYVRTDRGIAQPGDLKGKRVGVPEYQMSAAIWARAILKDEYGLDYTDMRWVEGGLEEWGRKSKVKLAVGPDFPLTQSPEGRSLNDMLATGELDAVVSPRAPSCFTAGTAPVRRLFEDFRSAERDYYRRTGIFPIMHAVGIRNDVAERHPWLPVSLMKAFEAARRIASRDLGEVAALKVGLPWLAQELAETREIMGADFWTYGLEPNRKTLEALVRYAYEQGIMAKPMKPEALFAPSTLDMSKI